MNIDSHDLLFVLTPGPRDVTDSIGAVFSKWSCYSEASALTAPLASIVPGPTAFYSTPVPAVAMAC